MDPEDALIEKIQTNLSKNGFPEKTVSFPADKIKTIVEKDELELDMILSRLSMAGIYSQESGDKLLFAASPDAFVPNANEEVPAGAAGDNIADMLGGMDGVGDMLGGIDPSMFAGKSKDDVIGMAQQMMSSMSDEDKAKMFEGFMKMPADQREKLMKQAGDMGLN